MNCKPDEGYIKFNYNWTKSELPKVDLEELIFWRQELYNAKLIGAYPDGIGFGNISQRYAGNKFIISASTTGNISKLDKSHFALVEDFDLEKNHLSCIGQMPASSESLSHAAIYQALENVHAIVHIHNLDLWKNKFNILPTTSPEISFGTPALAYAIQELTKKSETDFGIIVMGGHKEGLISYGTDIAAAANIFSKL